MRRVALALALGAIAAVVAAPLSTSALSKPRGPLDHEGRWITDARGRVVILHGVNMVYKRPPYEPAATGFGADDARFLERHGFNTVRLGIIYKGLEPLPPAGGTPSYSRSYLNSIAATERTLARHGVFTLLDFHQDLFHERFQGEGWPSWQVLDDGLPAQPRLGFPGNYVVMPALNSAFDHFWANDPARGIPLQTAYARAWRHVAARFAAKRHRPRRHLLGYDLLNEPWPGSAFPECLAPTGCRAFDTGPLTRFSERTVRGIRAADPRRLAFYEPLSSFNSAHPTYLDDLGDSRAGFSFHAYCLGGPATAACARSDAEVFDNADARAEMTGDALLLSEFGATDDLDVVGRAVDLSDQHMVGWQYWHYCGCDDPTTVGPGAEQALVIDPARPPSGDNVEREKLRSLARPFPRATAGTPTDFSFDPSSGLFELDYSARAPNGRRTERSLQTEIFVPRIQYPDGYRVRAHGATVHSRRNARVLRLRRDPGASNVSVSVRPRQRGRHSR